MIGWCSGSIGVLREDVPGQFKSSVVLFFSCFFFFLALINHIFILVSLHLIISVQKYSIRKSCVNGARKQENC